MAAWRQIAPATAASRSVHPADFMGRTFRRTGLVAIARANGDALASLGTTPRKNRLSALGLHTLPESVHLGAFAAVRLKCALGHDEYCAPTLKK